MLDGLAQGQILLADRGYDSDALRARLASQGAWGNMKPMPGRVNVPYFSPYLYRFRNLVERFFNKLKHFRAVATRYQKARRKLPRPRQTRRHPDMVSVYKSVT